MSADPERAPNATLSERSVRARARLSYVGVPRRLAWGYGYGSLCAVALGALAMTFRADWAILATLTALFIALCAHGFGCRVRVAVWPKAQGGYDVLVQRWGWSARYMAAKLPALTASEPSRRQRARANPFVSTQLDLNLDLGSRSIALPSLHIVGSYAAALERLDPFMRALRSLEPAQRIQQGARDEGAGGWVMPEFEASAAQRCEGLAWATGEGNALYLRYGVTLAQDAVTRGAALRFAAALGVVLLSTALPSSRALEARLQVAGAVLVVALALLAFATYAVRWTLPGPASVPVVVVQYRALGIPFHTRRFPLADGLRVLYAKVTSETSESTSTSTTAYLVTRAGQRHAINGMAEDDPATRARLSNFSSSLIQPSLVREALQPSQAEEPEPRYEEPPGAPGFAEPPRSRIAELGVFIAVVASLIAFGTGFKQLRELRHATAWVRTTYDWETVRAGKSTRTLFHPALDSTAELSPKPEVRKTDAPCWVIDDPHGHDIARYVPPTGPVTFFDKIRASLVLTCTGWLAAAALAAGPFIRRRRSLDVRAG